MTERLCEGKRCPGGWSSQALPGLRLCSVCRRTLTADLARIPDLYHDCEHRLAGKAKRGVERIRGGMPRGIVLDESVVQARSDMLATLASWAAIVVRERQLPTAPPRSIDALVRFLTDHVDSLAAHAVAGEVTGEVDALFSTTRRAIRPDCSMQVDLGACDHPGCDRPVSAVITGSEDPRPTGVRCQAGHVLSPHQWLLRAHLVEHARLACEKTKTGEVS